MKKYLLFFLLPLLVACSDWMELIPLDGLVKDEYWKTKEDVDAVLMGAYQLFAQQDDKLFMYGEIRGDMIKAGEQLDIDLLDVMEGNILPQYTLNNWQDFYKVINYANLVLKYASIVKDIDVTYSEYQMKGHEAEATFIRSLAYFYLVRTFRDVPFISEAIESDADELFPEKASAEDILSQIETDLVNARLGVTENYGSLEGNKGRATKAAINALLADIALWNFDYQACLDYVAEVESDEIEVISFSRWFEIFYPGNSVESIFEFQFNESLGENNSMFSLSLLPTGFLGSKVADDLLSPITKRGTGSMNFSTSFIMKYIGTSSDGNSIRPGAENQNANWIVYRMSDVKLMKAEALSQLERYSESLEVINNFRDKRGMLSIETPDFTAEAFEDIILNERAIEFAFEGKRWFDLLRMGRRNNFQRKSKLIEVLVQNVPASRRLLLSAKLTNPMGWYFPIQLTEIERNSNLIQNPYYAAFTN